jgi:hypothetical protein
MSELRNEVLSCIEGNSPLLFPCDDFVRMKRCMLGIDKSCGANCIYKEAPDD